MDMCLFMPCTWLGEKSKERKKKIYDKAPVIVFFHVIF